MMFLPPDLNSGVMFALLQRLGTSPVVSDFLKMISSGVLRVEAQFFNT
jgi:hypothetical protein